MSTKKKGRILESWVWTIPGTAQRLPFANYDDVKSQISSYEVMTVRRLPEATIILQLPTVPSKKLTKRHYVPSYDRTPLVNEVLVEIIDGLARKDVQFMPVTLVTKDKEVMGYYFARPLVELPCTDIEKSDVTDWIIPGEKIMDARHLLFKPNCLGEKHFARDRFTSHIVVSEELKSILLKTGDDGLNFQKPEDIWNIYAK